MNFARNAILTAIIFQMTHATFPLRSTEAYAGEVKATEEQTTVPSTNTFLESVMEQKKALITAGCIDKDGNVTSRTLVDQQEIQKDNGKAFNCYQAVMNYLPAEKQALEIMNEQAAVKNENCTDCGTGMDTILKHTGDAQNWVENKLGEGKSCSEKEKAAIQVENKSCNYSCGVKNAAIATVNTLNSLNPVMIPVKMMFGDLKTSTAPNCPVAQGNAGDCIWSILKTFVLSMGDLLLGVWNGIAGAANSATKWVGGLFSAHKEAEVTATKKMHAVTAMSDKEIETAKKDGGKSFLQKMKSGLLSLVDFLTNYKELGTEFDCVHCKDKLKPVCKVLGLVGRDLVIMWLSGKALSAMGPLVKKLANKNILTRRLYRKSFIAIGRVSQKTAAKWATFKASTIKFSKKSFKKTSEIPGKIVVAAHKGTTRLVDKMGLNDDVLRKSMGSKDAKAAVQSIDEAVAKSDELLVGMEASGQAEAVASAKDAITKLPNAKKWAKAEHFENIETASPTEFKVKENFTTQSEKTTFNGKGRPVAAQKARVNESSVVEVQTPEGVQEFSIDPAKKVASVELYQDAKGATNAIVKYTDKSATIHTPQGTAKIPLEKAAVLDEATGKTIHGKPADDVRLEAVQENVRENNITVTKTNPDGSIEYKAPNDCGSGVIGKAGLAL